MGEMKGEFIMDKATEFVINVEYLLKQRGITFKNYEKEVGVSPGYFSRCKSGKKYVSLKLAFKMADALGMTIEEIIALDAKAIRIAQLEAELRELRGEADGQ